MQTEKEKKGQPTAMRKTIADIADEIRRAVASMGDEMPYTVSAGTMRRVADRIEAAWKSEREDLELCVTRITRKECRAEYCKSVGNAAAMRDALETIHDKVNSLDEECGVDPVEIRDLARAALAAPARNCDLKECSTDDGMISAHEGFCESWHERGKTCAECPHKPKSPMMTCREKWLLAPAAERKGE